MDGPQWYYASAKGKKGPIGPEQIKTLIDAEVIGPNTLVWIDGMVDWEPADNAFPEDIKPSSWRQPPDLSADRQANFGRPPLSAGISTSHPTGMTECVGAVFSKYAAFSGRARRSEFWYFALFNLLVGLMLLIADVAIFGLHTELSPLQSIYSLGVLVPSLAVGARRLHDTGRSGWWQLIMLIPLVGIIVLIVWFASRGDDGENRYGPA